MSLSDKERQSKRRAKKKEAGLVSKQWWIKSEWVELLDYIINFLKKR